MHRARLALLLGLGALVLAGCTTSGAPVRPAPPEGTSPAASAERASTAGAPASRGSEAAAVAPAQSGFTLRLDGSEARYRARETFVNIPTPNEAVGRTTAVTGSIVLDGNNQVVREQSVVVVDVSTLRSDEERRDNYLRENTLRTAQYPTVTFRPTEVRGLPTPLPTSGEVQFQVAGDLTIRDVTRPVVWDVAATVDGQTVSGVARYDFYFGEWGVPVPQVARVASIFEPVVLEIEFRGTNAS
ncbi:MAG TPA: YceI family protein [Chloroflexota bacterium]|jgi:polyisoprenoid-binding protein YceI|nr:YceI family protein [Chloroflexota bacterium]